ncbi:MAG: hypothetical protein D6679_10560 [Candidatus Hydrogenedentota bacterium]|nr:MAG: hypothetical protein D6679_10560 [Candidatus Hydrogenedentota bacterium]
MYRRLYRLLLVLLLLPVVSCGGAVEKKKPAPRTTNPAPAKAAIAEKNVPAPEEVVARVGDRYLTVEDFETIDPKHSLTSEQIAEYVRNWVDRQLMTAVAEEMGLERKREVRREIEAARERILIRELGHALAESAESETAARRALFDRVEEMRARKRVETYPWRVR